MPMASPVRNQTVMPTSRCCPASRFDAKPEALMRKMQTSEVASACSMGIAVTRSSAGTTRNPPPTPNVPERIPVSPPHVSSFNPHDQPSRRTPSASRRHAKRESGFVSRFAPRHIRTLINVISEANRRRVQNSGKRTPSQAPPSAPRIPSTPKIAPGAQLTSRRWMTDP